LVRFEDTIMVIRIELRTHNWKMRFLLYKGYGAYEARHDGDYLHIAMDMDSKVYEIDGTKATEGPAIKRKGGITRGRCDKVRMMYVPEDGVKFLYQSKFRPNPPNSTQTCTEQNLKNEAAIVREYCEWRGGEYLPPAFARHVGGHPVDDDGCIRIKD
jgi:hypothetical protein